MLLVIGDSHSVIWGGKLVNKDTSSQSNFPLVKVHHLGPRLAFNLLSDDGGLAKWGVETYSVIQKYPDISALCLSFGEIDIRTQSVKRAVLEGISLKESANRIADIVFRFIIKLRQEFDFPIFVSG